MSDEATGASAPFARERVDPLEKHKAILDPLRKQYDGRIASFEFGKHGIFVFRFATGSELRLHEKKIRAANKLEEDDARNEAVLYESLEFAKRVLAYPEEKAKLSVALEDYWQAVPAVLGTINRISGASVEELGKG